ncbi:hypothetical protein MSC49_09570 [Methylosinus sp. C49]|nr:hypothetical protein MSC49_09570 [Methylosinus sp. C49]
MRGPIFMTDNLNEPIEIRWRFAHHGAAAIIMTPLALSALWLAFSESGLRFLAPFWFAALFQGLVGLARMIDRRPKVVLTRDGFSCPGWFAGELAWSDVERVGEISLLGASFPYFVLRRDAADRLAWRGADRWLRLTQRGRRAPLLFRLGELDMSAARFSAIVTARVAPALAPVRPPVTLAQLSFSPLYAREYALSWLALPATLLFEPPPAFVPFIWLQIALFAFFTVGPELLTVRRAQAS